MDINKTYLKKQIFLNNSNIVDNYISIMLTKTFEIYEYIDTKRDEKIFQIDRQFINPYYIGFNFFNSINRIKVNKSSDLTPSMIKYIRTQYGNTAHLGNAYKISGIKKFNSNYLAAYPNEPLKDYLGIEIDVSSQQNTLPLSNKFIISGTNYYDGAYIMKDLSSKYVVRDPVSGKYTTFFVKPNRVSQVAPTIINGNYDLLDLTTHQGMTMQAIQDKFNSTIEYSFDDSDWDVKYWFDVSGYNVLTIDKDPTTGDTGIDKLEKIIYSNNSLISKANFFPITINK